MKRLAALLVLVCACAFGQSWNLSTENREDSRSHNTTGTNTHNGTETFNDARFKGSPWVDVRAYGAKGDCTTDDTAAIQSAFDTGKQVFFSMPSPNTGCYKLTSRIRIHEYGQGFKCAGPLLVRIVQTGANADAFFIDKADSTHPELSLTGGAQLFNLIDGCEIEGPGSGTSTGYGIDASGDGSSHSGDYLVIRNSRIKGFARGIYTKGWGMVQIEATISQLNVYGAYFDVGSSNSYNLRGLNTNQNTTVGIYWTGGLGNTVLLGDQGAQPRHIEVANGQVTFIGGNMESYTGTDAVKVDTNASATFIGQYVNQLAGGQTTNPFQADANATMTLIGVRKAGYVSGTCIAAKIADSASIRGIVEKAGSVDAGDRCIQNGTQQYRIAAEDSRLNTGAAAASADLRGSCWFIAGVAGVADKRYCYAKDASGTYYVKDVLAAFQGGQQFQGWCIGTASSGTTLSLFLMGQASTSANCTTAPNDNGRLIMTQGGTLDSLRVIAGAAGVNASSGVVSVYVNNILSAVTCTVGTGTSCTDLTHSVTVAAGDQVSIRFTTQTSETLGSVRAAFLLH